MFLLLSCILSIQTGHCLESNERDKNVGGKRKDQAYQRAFKFPLTPFCQNASDYWHVAAPFLWLFCSFLVTNYFCSFAQKASLTMCCYVAVWYGSSFEVSGRNAAVGVPQITLHHDYFLYYPIGSEMRRAKKPPAVFRSVWMCGAGEIKKCSGGEQQGPP